MTHKIYEYAVFYEPTKKEMDEGGEARFIINPQYVIATGEETARTKASMSIPEEYAEKLDRVKIVTRPF